MSLVDQSSDPAGAANSSTLYAKDDSGASQLFWRSGTGAVVQLTAAGGLRAESLVGTVPDARLSSNVPLKDAPNTFTDRITFTSTSSGSAGSSIVLQSASPGITLVEEDAGEDEKAWGIARPVNGRLVFFTATDAQIGSVGNTFMAVERSGTTVTEVELNATTFDFNGDVDISGTLAVGGVSTFSGTVSLARQSSARLLDLVNTDTSQIWAIRTQTDRLQIGARSSTGSWSNPPAFTITRSGDTITQVEVPVAVLAGTVATSTSSTLSVGRVHVITGNATLPNLTAGEWVGVINNSNSPITITKHASDTMYWTASGASVTSVTVAARGKATFFAATNANVYASGSITGAS